MYLIFSIMYYSICSGFDLARPQVSLIVIFNQFTVVRCIYIIDISVTHPVIRDIITITPLSFPTGRSLSSNYLWYHFMLRRRILVVLSLDWVVLRTVVYFLDMSRPRFLPRFNSSYQFIRLTLYCSLPRLIIFARNYLIEHIVNLIQQA